MLKPTLLSLHLPHAQEVRSGEDELTRSEKRLRQLTSELELERVRNAELRRKCTASQLG